MPSILGYEDCTSALPPTLAERTARPVDELAKICIGEQGRKRKDLAQFCGNDKEYEKSGWFDQTRMYYRVQIDRVVHSPR